MAMSAKNFVSDVLPLPLKNLRSNHNETVWLETVIGMIALRRGGVEGGDNRERRKDYRPVRRLGLGYS